MGSLLLLATTASEVESELAKAGFGLNLDILETNIVNLLIVIGILFYFGRGFLGNILSERRAKIETAIREAEERVKQAEAALAEGEKKLAQAQEEAKRILAAAEENAKAAREAILARAAKDIEKMRAEAARDMESERERISKEIRARVAAMALEKVELQLKERLDDYAQNKLIERSIAMLGGSK
ncbi:MAG: F0F1 ATP synthase subunit B [Oscillatoriaceae bacterium SKW80]|nr:F0F1 ATP synthase subunit B [Oscillatoriaceae bacterium SKYG93]MCX8120626.1 F0F1 ATP synthase subunit B [Oscillatoriaceae bacterium SKW80]MDW8453835.1 F0F1 ATP synthase subunit B [Oscillatoriaceae cyanobacterium SKYGB_i_bin93]HIK27066.1 F0F1 ATP synthase subunit B [Oscillatoriaceae cyanobacterium M7585_C2015_266]